MSWVLALLEWAFHAGLDQVSGLFPGPADDMDEDPWFGVAPGSRR